MKGRCGEVGGYGGMGVFRPGTLASLGKLLEGCLQVMKLIPVVRHRLDAKGMRDTRCHVGGGDMANSGKL